MAVGNNNSSQDSTCTITGTV